MSNRTPPATLDEFMAQALAMEIEASQRYTEMADAMEVHNNREVGELFRKMAVIEGKHAQQIMDQMGWHSVPPNVRAPAWEGFEAAESVSHEDLHYRMQPWHALQLALKAEQRAQSFYARLVDVVTVETVRGAAREMRDEEREHVELIQAWIAKVPPPDPDWDEDPDPPRYDQ